MKQLNGADRQYPMTGAVDLPPDIQQIIRRKSSRDPTSRFSIKLHALLMHADNDPSRQEALGLGWLTDTAFRLNKKRLVAVMEIKHNTLNVNLKDLKFRQSEKENNGWTVWEREGFSRFSTIEELADLKAETPGEGVPIPFADDAQAMKLVMLRDLNFGFVDPPTAQMFKRFTISIWEELLPQVPLQYIVSPPEFLSVAAERFRASHQKLENSLKILKAVFVCPNSAQLSMLDFAKFMAKFGPEETLMQKLDSILKSSNRNQNWLKLSKPPVEEQPLIYGYFDDVEHNCFVLQRLDQPEERIYNLINVPATDDYLVDSKGMKYASWQKYFEMNPLPLQTVWTSLSDWPQFMF
jgi:hypothetical protein